jgi:hypothetical protein
MSTAAGRRGRVWIAPLVVLEFALVGWAFCGAIMGLLPGWAGMDAALWIHAIAGPAFCAGLSFVYQRRFSHYSPLAFALAFTGLVVALDVFVVGALILGSMDMFRSAIGTWIPFALILTGTWAAGKIGRKAIRR